jgi:gliding motility-associated protein GldC
MKRSDIKFSITLDENKLPEKIEWSADDAGMEKPADCKAMMLSVWDPSENNTLRIDLWTKDMLVDDMKQFFYQTLISMSDTLARSTNENELATELKTFSKEFGKKMGLDKK